MTSFKALLHRIWSAARWQFLGTAALAIVLSCTEGVSIGIVFPVIALLGPAADPAAARVAGPRTQMVLAWLGAAHIPRTLWLTTLLILVLLSVALLGQCNGVLQALSLNLTLRLRRNLSGELFSAILHADWLFLTRRRASDLTQLLTDEMLRVGTACGALTSLIANGVVALFLLAVAAWLAPWLTLATLAALALLLPWYRRVARRLYIAGESISLRWRDIFDSAAARIQNLKVVKAFAAEQTELSLYNGRFRLTAGELLASEWQLQTSSRSFQLLVLLLLSVLLLVGNGPMHLAGGTLLVFLLAFMRATPRLTALQSSLASLAAQLPAVAAIESALADCRQNADPTEQEATSTAPALTRELTLRAVTFGYPGQPPVLVAVDLTLPAGQILALTGASGEGKSTIADLVMGLLAPETGQVAVDAVPITRSNARAWRRRIGYVTQDTVLFHDSIRANLLWARPEASAEQIAGALAAANADFVAALPQGLETVVGDRGVTLSHGQRQRLALARALLIEPELLILDEATNSLDLETEAKVLKTVQAYSPRLTTLLISHRPSALTIADRVLVLAEGAIRELQGKRRD